MDHCLNASLPCLPIDGCIDKARSIHSTSTKQPTKDCTRGRAQILTRAKAITKRHLNHPTLWRKFRAKSLTSISTRSFSILFLFNSRWLFAAAFVSRFTWGSQHDGIVLDSFGPGSKTSPKRVQTQQPYVILAIPFVFVFVLDSLGPGSKTSPKIIYHVLLGFWTLTPFRLL